MTVISQLHNNQMYSVELETKETTDSNTSVYALDLLLLIWRDCQLHTAIYDKRIELKLPVPG